MPFDQSPIFEVFPPKWINGDIHLAWTSTAPSGSWYQVYIGRRLVWWGTETSATIPPPEDTDSRVDVHIGVVDATERSNDFSADLPVSMGSRVTLSWTGGTFEAPDIAGFRIYASSGPGQPIDYATAVAEILAYTPGVYTDGYGYGGYGEGGYGAAASYYTWTSNAIAAGSWQFAVVPFDLAGNEGAGSVVSTVIYAPPQPPARNLRGERLTYTYSPATRKVTLNWLPSPG